MAEGSRGLTIPSVNKEAARFEQTKYISEIALFPANPNTNEFGESVESSEVISVYFTDKEPKAYAFKYDE